jgi:hypothetical protein
MDHLFKLAVVVFIAWALASVAVYFLNYFHI